jgi:hypothetical protein
METTLKLRRIVESLAKANDIEKEWEKIGEDIRPFVLPFVENLRAEFVMLIDGKEVTLELLEDNKRLSNLLAKVYELTTGNDANLVGTRNFSVPDIALFHYFIHGYVNDVSALGRQVMTQRGRPEKAKEFKNRYSEYLGNPDFITKGRDKGVRLRKMSTALWYNGHREAAIKAYMFAWKLGG